MPIYDLNNITFLEHDIDNILDIVNSLYVVEFTKDKTTFYPKTFIPKDEHWTSEISKNTFNKLVPTAKSLIKDMYAVLEHIYKGQTGKFEKLELEKKYNYLKEFRLINNKLKHFNDQEAEINLTELVFIEPTGNYIDIYCTFKYKNDFQSLRLSDFIDIYLNILDDNKIITINRTK
jgi:hypothetical protein